MDLFLSLLAGVGATPASAVHHETMPDGLLAVALAFSLTHVVSLLKGL